MIIKDLFTNFTVLVALLFIYSQITENRPLNRTSTFKRKLTVGTLGGLLGFILMQYSIHLGDTIIDLRHIAIILMAYYGGAIPAFLSMALIMLGRFLIGINISAYSAIPMVLLITIGAVYIAKGNLSRNSKIFSILTWCNVTISLTMGFLIGDIDILILLIPSYWLVSYVGGFIAFYIIDTIRETQLLFNKYKDESSIDGLTGLNNYRKFDDIFNNLIKTIDEKGEELSLLYIDIDFFKKINDTHGHTQGDDVLKQLGEILQNNTRSFDIVSRNGGEEFTVLLLDCPVEKALEFAENIRKTVEAYAFQLKTGNIHITISIGVSCYKNTTSNLNHLVEDADKALYQAKNTGRNRVCVARSNHE